MNYRDELLELINKVLNESRSHSRAWIRSIERKARENDPDLSDEIKNIMSSAAQTHEYEMGSSPLRSSPPKDKDSGLSLAIVKENPTVEKPIFISSLQEEIHSLISEWKKKDSLLNEGLLPTNTVLFKGLPGVGKTMTAHWIASKLDLSLVILDLASVVSSYLGRTGSNVKSVLKYAEDNPCVLLLDEFDTIAKKRDDDQDVGELKRLVNVLLQTIDGWDCESLLISATNHPDLLDHAIWRRFDKIIDFPLPDLDDLIYAFKKKLPPEHTPDKTLIKILFQAIEGEINFSTVDRIIKNIKRQSVIDEKSFEEQFHDYLSKITDKHKLDVEKKKKLAKELRDNGFSQRESSRLLHMSRHTIRNIEKEKPSHARS